MRSRRGQSNQIVLVALLVYALATLPLVESALVIVFGLIAASVFKSNDTLPLAMFGYVARLVTNFRNKGASQLSSPLRTKIIRVCAAIDEYPGYVSSIVYRKRQLFFMLNKQQQHAASQTYKRLLEIEKLKDENYTFLTKVKQFAMQEFRIHEYEIHATGSSTGPTNHKNAYEAVELLEHFVRDWSVQQAHQRARAELLAPLLTKLKHKNRILVPGFGLGRLAADLAAEGSAVIDAPEMSAAMWLGAKYATSRLENPEEIDDFVYPFLLQFSYWRKGTDQLEPVPLVFPPNRRQPNFVCADFLTFNNGVKYDGVATLYFIDTAQNIFAYIDKIANSLEPGGLWCNYGPLKWGSAPFVEFSVDELLAYLQSSGWRILETWTEGSNRYNGSEKSMLNSKYDLIGWVAQRK